MRVQRPTLVRILAIALSLSFGSTFCFLPLQNVVRGSQCATRPQLPTLCPPSDVSTASTNRLRPASLQNLSATLAGSQLEADAPADHGRWWWRQSRQGQRPGRVRRCAGADPWVGEPAAAGAAAGLSEKPVRQAAHVTTRKSVSDDGLPLPFAESTFRELFADRLPDWLLGRLEELGFVSPTLVQRQALEIIMGGDTDAVLHAQTGSGKTLAFLLPLFALVNPSRAAVQGLIVVPTRELGLQVANVAKRLAAGASPTTGGKIQVMSVLEGSSNKRQRAWAWADPPHIVVGNPENLSRLVSTGAVRVNAVSYVVVDEVDACLLSEATRASLHELLARSLSPTHAEEGEEEEEEEARLVAVGAGRVTGAALPVIRRAKDRQTVFASATVPQHNHFIRQCVQVGVCGGLLCVGVCLLTETWMQCVLGGRAPRGGGHSATT